jgi:MFS family permease
MKNERQKLLAKNQKIQEESFGGDSEDRGSFDEKYLKTGTIKTESGLEEALTQKKKKAIKKDTESKGGFFKKAKHPDQGDEDDDYDDEIEIDEHTAHQEGRRSNRDYDIDMHLKEHEQPSLILYKYRWVVLFAYFLTSTATGAVQGSLSENRAIIDKIEPGMDKADLDWCKYSDLVMYLPMNFLSIYIIENMGLRKCVILGSLIMIVGSVMRFMSVFASGWWWFFGHIVCMSSQAYLKNPVTKLASNWFGDKERGTATAIGIVSGPLGIFISKILILAIFDDKDKYMQYDGGSPVEVSRAHFKTFIAIHSILSVALVIPALFLIREKPPSPPSMVATKHRPVQTFREAYTGLTSNVNYMLIFLYFQCVNSVSIYNAEIEPFTNQY